MTEQSQIPAPTPEDDVVPHQERYEFIVKNMLDAQPKALGFPEHFANPDGTPSGLVSVLPKVFRQGDYDYFMGLVTVEAGTVPAEVVISEEPWQSYGWSLHTPTIAMTFADLSSDAGFVNGGVAHPAGLYMAVYADNTGQHLPTSFPAGWTPGNTTGEGPVLPIVDSYDSGGTYNWYAGLVRVAGDAREPYVPGSPYWYLFPVDTALDNDGLSGATPIDAPAPDGIYVAAYSDSTDVAAPTALPSGWHFQPYGVGDAGPVLGALVESLPKVEAPICFALNHDGDNNSPLLYIYGNERHVDNTGRKQASASGLCVALPAGGSFNLARDYVEGDNRPITLHYCEIVVAKLGSTDRIIAQLTNPTTPAVPTSSVAIPITSDWDVVGTDLTVSDGEIVTAAGGDFLISLNFYFNL